MNAELSLEPLKILLCWYLNPQLLAILSIVSTGWSLLIHISQNMNANCKFINCFYVWAMPVVGGLLSVRCKSPYTVQLGTPKLLAGFVNSTASPFKIHN